MENKTDKSLCGKKTGAGNGRYAELDEDEVTQVTGGLFLKRAGHEYEPDQRESMANPQRTESAKTGNFAAQNVSDALLGTGVGGIATFPLKDR